ncbi:PTS mannose transporter subunit IID [Salmonella enterica subsp. diarizonae]|uniref:PTS mannose transporter subunit IID n=1 Tax=Salmonella diarizonae TaxID=59204 RepID=A0A5Y3WC46_SALDZ|nr:PTS mannose transporter subunit IID [Salmonella enterica subsp. diarizonae]EBG1930060.1 PTS sugar transporter subunit IIA [Salmonella enterica]EBZ8403819.1 PTS sugar transporter subunit IIA [Salmonella enterica subsp. enterica serovar Muenchen]ECF1925018.1 PTS sugar transporter subunit IIA [Salmonella enterica subsp. enterica serovar Newport]HEB6458734.1 PTS sugar transporter subunit IIA [Salmonella enterica subsp. enterica serovar Hvittingfoss]
MTNLLIVSHGNFASTLLETSEMFIGKSEIVKAINYMPEESPDLLYQKIEEAIKGNINPDGVIIFCDMKGGSPANVAMKIASNKKIKIVTGVNIPVIVEAITLAEDENLDELIESLSKVIPNSLEII